VFYATKKNKKKKKKKKKKIKYEGKLQDGPKLA